MVSAMPVGQYLFPEFLLLTLTADTIYAWIVVAQKI